MKQARKATVRKSLPKPQPVPVLTPYAVASPEELRAMWERERAEMDARREAVTADCLCEMIRVCLDFSRKPSYFLKLVAHVLNDRTFEIHLRNPLQAERITFAGAADLIAKLAEDIRDLEQKANEPYVRK